MLTNERFDNKPKVQRTKLNVLPSNPEASDPEKAVGPGRFPSWLHRKLPKGSELSQTGHILEQNRLHTVCEEARCPNLLECWSKKTATFLVMGKECTRSCGFCDIDYSRTPKPLELDEPARVADSVVKLGLRHVVITMVARDDLPDGGASHLAAIMREIRSSVSSVTIEILISDLGGKHESLDVLLEAKPDIFNHNIETVRELTPKVRHTATYDRTLSVLRYVKQNANNPKMKIKSGMMLGLGETEQQIHQAIQDLYSAGCDIITIGQYLQPSKNKIRVKSFITPDQFKGYEAYGYSLGVNHMFCGPFVRSSYNADLFIDPSCLSESSL
jgi:lipoic acid synthetase